MVDTRFKKIIVTGATGFLGSRIVEGLQGYGAAVIAVGRNPARRTELESLGATFVQADLCDREALEKIVQGADLIIHCAALSSPWGTWQMFYDANVRATEILKDAALQSGVKRFIHISTPSIYFNFKNRRMIKESEPLPEKMVNHYAATKYLAEKVIQESGLPFVIIRPRAIIGRGDTVIMPRVLEAYRQNRLKIVGTGKNVVSVTPVANVVQAVRLSMDARENALGKAYNIAGGEEIELWQIIGDMLRHLDLPFQPKKIPYPIAAAAAGMMETWSRWISGREPVLTRYSVAIMAKDMTLDISRAKELLGYEPVQTAAEGIAEFAEWYCNKSRIK